MCNDEEEMILYQVHAMNHYLKKCHSPNPYCRHLFVSKCKIKNYVSKKTSSFHVK